MALSGVYRLFTTIVYTLVNVNAPVVAFLRTGDGLKGKKIYTC